MESTKKTNGLLWWVVVIFAIIAGLFCSVLTIGTISYFEQREVILEDKNTKKDAKVQAQEMFLFNEQGVKVTFLGLNKSTSPFGNTIDFEIENKSAKEVSISYDYLKVNGIVVTGIMHERVAPGKIVQVGTTIDNKLDDIKIDKIAELAFGMRLYNGDYYKYGEFRVKTSHYGSVDQDSYYTNRVKLAQESVVDGTITISLLPDLTLEKDGKTKQFIMIENETDSPISLHASGLVYNGTSVKDVTYLPERIPPHSKSIELVDIKIPDDIIQALGSEMTSLELLLDIDGHTETAFLYHVDNVSIKLK